MPQGGPHRPMARGRMGRVVQLGLRGQKQELEQGNRERGPGAAAWDGGHRWSKLSEQPPN